MDLGFSTRRDFEVILDLPESNRREKIQKNMLVQEGIRILQDIIAEPESVRVYDEQIDPNDPKEPSDYREIPIPNPMWRRYGFNGKDDVQLMLNKYLER